ncbi:MAG: helix-turn-helix domain-containing protein, partial [Oscillibacter sp.]|nr:helix-turn-helix domain-containing protein [Oscillibacter sp.]
MIRTLKVMLTPNNRQKTRMFQYAGAARYAYNWALETERANHENGGRFLTDVDLRRVFTQHKAEPGKGWLFT